MYCTLRRWGPDFDTKIRKVSTNFSSTLWGLGLALASRTIANVRPLNRRVYHSVSSHLHTTLPVAPKLPSIVSPLACEALGFPKIAKMAPKLPRAYRQHTIVDERVHLLLGVARSVIVRVMKFVMLFENLHVSDGRLYNPSWVLLKLFRKVGRSIDAAAFWRVRRSCMLVIVEGPKLDPSPAYTSTAVRVANQLCFSFNRSQQAGKLASRLLILSSNAIVSYWKV